MRILSWVELFWPHIGGIEVRTANFLVAMRERGHEVAVITNHGSLSLPDEDSYKGIHIHRFRFLEALSGQHLELFARSLRGVRAVKGQFQPDLVHIQFTDPSPLFHWQTMQGSSIPTVVTVPIALPDASDADNTLSGRTLNSASWVVACSEAILRRTVRQAPGIVARSSVIYNALPFPAVDPRPPSASPPVLLAIGRVVREKGFDMAIDAMPRVMETFPDARLIIAGDGPERLALESQANRLGLSNHVRFEGWVDPGKVAALINDCSLVLMPSRCEEAFGLVALQAMQMARPVVATQVGGLPEVVAHGHSGIVVPNENPAALAEAVIQLLSDAAGSARMGMAGFELARTRFSFERFVAEHESLYTKVVNHR